MEGVTTAIEDHKADMDNKIKQLQVAISVKIVDNLKDVQNYIDQDMVNFVNQTRAVSEEDVGEWYEWEVGVSERLV